MHHMIPLFDYVNKRSNYQVRPIIWDDMLRKWSVTDLKSKLWVRSLNLGFK